MYKKGSTKTVYSYLPCGTLYKAGSSVSTVGRGYSSGTLYYGNGSSGYLRGGSVSARYNYYTYSGALYDADGERVNRNQTFFYGGSSGTLYYGDGSYVTGRGSAVDAIEWNGTLYDKGSTVTQVGTAVEDAYQRNPEEDETFSAIGGECSLKLATLTTRNVTALTV